MGVEPLGDDGHLEMIAVAGHGGCHASIVKSGIRAGTGQHPRLRHPTAVEFDGAFSLDQQCHPTGVPQ